MLVYIEFNLSVYSRAVSRPHETIVSTFGDGPSLPSRLSERSRFNLY